MWGDAMTLAVRMARMALVENFILMLEVLVFLEVFDVVWIVGEVLGT